jgi:hypothetical protein
MKRFFHRLKVKDFTTLTIWVILGFAWMQIDQIFLPEIYQRFFALVILLILFFYFQFRINRPVHIIQYANSIAAVTLSATMAIIVVQHVIITFDIQWKALLILFLTGIFPYIGAFVYKLTMKNQYKTDEINPIELGRQLKKPTGTIGLQVAENMNVANHQIYDFVFSHLNIEDNSKILVIGCGNGKFISKFFDANSKIHLTVVDYSDVMCKETTLSNKVLINDNKLIVKCEDAIDMSISDETIDIVVTINTVYFWEQVDKQLLEIKRIMKTGGLLVIGYRPKSVMKDFPSTQEVFTLYEPEDLQLLVKQNGFEIIKEVKQATNRIAVDGSWVQSVDICLMVKKR